MSGTSARRRASRFLPRHDERRVLLMKTPGGANRRDRRAKIQVWRNPILNGSLEHAEDDGADKDEGDIRGDNAQSADERSCEAHCNAPLVHVVPAQNIEG